MNARRCRRQSSPPGHRFGRGRRYQYRSRPRSAGVRERLRLGPAESPRRRPAARPARPGPVPGRADGRGRARSAWDRSTAAVTVSVRPSVSASTARLHAPAGGGEPYVVRGLRAGGHGGQASDLAGAVVEEREYPAGAALAGPQGVEWMHERRDREPDTAQQQLQFGHARADRGRACPAAGEPGGGLGGAGVDAVQGSLDPGVGGGVRGDRQHEHHGQQGAQRADAGLREPQGEQAGSRTPSRPYRSSASSVTAEHHPRVRDARPCRRCRRRRRRRARRSGRRAPAAERRRARPSAMPSTVPRTRRKPRTRVSPREVVFTKIHQAAPTAQYQRSPDTSWPTTRAKPAATVAWTA